MKKLFLFFSIILAIQLQAQKYEAENASYSGTNTIENISGASGSCILFENLNDYVRVTANISVGGTYKIYVAYASPFGDKDGNVSINGNNKTVTFSETSACTEMLIGNYNLSAGSNTIEVTPDWTWFYVDYIRIESENNDGNGDEENPDQSGKGFKVSGSKLLDANGKEFVMRGVNMAWVWYTSSGMSQLEAIARAGANAVRIVLADGSKWGKVSASTVASLISKCEELKMVAILEVHDYTGSNSTSDVEAAAQYFADLKNTLIGKEATVIINIANEWYGSWNSLENWENGYKSAISIVRNAGLDHCIMVDAAGWGQCSPSVHNRGANVLDADPNKNVIFSIHMYGTAGKTSNIKSNINNVIDQNLALCIGEFGWYHSDGDVDEDLILSHCSEKNVGWLAWSWYGNGEGVEYLDLVTSPGNENALNSPTYNSVTCNWGEKIVNAWKEEAETCSVFTDNTVTINEEIAANETAVYPTKLDDVFYVKSQGECKILICDLSGKIISTIFATEGLTTVSCADWNQGIYLVSIIYGDKKLNYKVIK